jgi:CBS domain-containing protein
MSLNPTIRVKAAMNRKMVTLNKNLNIGSAIKLMVRKNIGSVVVTGEANNNPVGIVTERDILRSIAYRRTRHETTKIEEIMSKPLISIESDATLGDAAEMMIKKNIRRLIVKDNSKYVGIITQRDLQKLMTETIKALLIM